MNYKHKRVTEISEHDRLIERINMDLAKKPKQKGYIPPQEQNPDYMDKINNYSEVRA